jgi:hypothetical protein
LKESVVHPLVVLVVMVVEVVVVAVENVVVVVMVDNCMQVAVHVSSESEAEELGASETVEDLDSRHTVAAAAVVVVAVVERIAVAVIAVDAVAAEMDSCMTVAGFVVEEHVLLTEGVAVSWGNRRIGAVAKIADHVWHKVVFDHTIDVAAVVVVVVVVVVAAAAVGIVIDQVEIAAAQTAAAAVVVVERTSPSFNTK